MPSQVNTGPASNRPAAYRREDFLSWLGEKYGADFNFVADQLPSVIIRARYSDLAKHLGLPLCSKSLANLDSRGQGPRRFM